MSGGNSCRIGVISDTHGFLDPRVFEIFEGVERIVHAGDVGDDDLLCELEAIAPVYAVTGNVDGVPEPRLRPLFRQLETPLGRLAVTHGHLTCAPSTNLDALARWFGEFGPAVVIYGHSHIARLERVGETWLFNPGAAGRARFGRAPSVGVISAGAEGEIRFEHVELD